jgi:hypothetical protein
MRTQQLLLRTIWCRVPQSTTGTTTLTEQDSMLSTTAYDGCTTAVHLAHTINETSFIQNKRANRMHVSNPKAPTAQGPTEPDLRACLLLSCKHAVW